MSEFTGSETPFGTARRPVTGKLCGRGLRDTAALAPQLVWHVPGSGSPTGTAGGTWRLAVHPLARSACDEQPADEAVRRAKDLHDTAAVLQAHHRPRAHPGDAAGLITNDAATDYQHALGAGLSPLAPLVEKPWGRADPHDVRDLPDYLIKISSPAAC